MPLMRPRFKINRRALLQSMAAAATNPFIGARAENRIPSMRFLAPGESLRSVGVSTPFAYSEPDPNNPEKYAQNPWVSGWPTWATAMPKRLITALKSSGFTGLRLAIDPGPMLAASNDETLMYLIGRITVAVDDIVANGLKCIVDMHISPAPSSVPGYGDTDLIDGTDGPKFRRLVKVEQMIGATLETSYSATSAALELFNEPPLTNKRTPWVEQLNYLYNAVRAFAPNLTLIVAGEDLDSASALIKLDPSAFDENTLFSFHSYDPLEFTCQSVPLSAFQDVQYISRLPFPPQSGDKVSAIAAATRAIKADDRLPWGVRQRYIRQIAVRLSHYFDTPCDEHWLGTLFSPVARWADRNGLSHNRIILGEFGAWGDYDRHIGADEMSRANYLRAVRRQAEALGFGWSVWELSSPVTAWGITDDSRVLAPNLVTALGLNP